MAKSKRRHRPGRHSGGHQGANDAASGAPSRFQPLHMFFNRANRYDAIPNEANDQNNDYFSASPTDINGAHNVLIDISHPNREPNDQMAYNSDADTSADGAHHDSIEEDVCFPAPNEKQEGADFDALDEFVRDENEQTHLQTDKQRRRRLSTMNTLDRRQSLYGDRNKHLGSDGSDVFRVSFYSVAEPSTIHVRSLADIPTNGEKLSSMMKKGCFWLDILSPTDMEMKALSKAFHIHPLTVEDITMEEQREKCEMFKNYYFICFRSFEQNQFAVNFLQPIGLYIIVLQEGVITFHFRPTPHPHNVRKRIKQLKDYIDVTPDWICYGLLDDITDSFAPLIRAIEFEVDSIDELVLILKESEQSDMLRRIGHCRKRIMSLLRLLVAKVDVVKTLVKRGDIKTTENARPALSNEVALYLGDVQDHIITMVQALNHYETISSRSHSNYLAQISIEMTQTNNEMNDVLGKLTALGSVLVPMNLVTGLWGMNVLVPGQNQEDLSWFFSITFSIILFCVGSTILMKFYNIV